MPNPPDRISQWAAEARALGLSYGQYVAKYHPSNSLDSPPVVHTKTCPECGQVFRAISRRHTYCCEACCHRFHNRKYYHYAKEKRLC